MPAWLNDPTLYHNRGDSTFAGESAEYGDFVGLDDLFTEQPKCQQGMTDIYKTWVDFGIDGFRIDTVKHVNMEFWQSFSPAMQAEAKAQGNDDFFMFGEVYDARPSFMSQYTTTGKLPATLDFGFQAAAKDFAQGKPTTGMRDLIAGDDYYTDTDSNAYELPTFLGNHDMGRVGYFLKSGGVAASELLQRDVAGAPADVPDPRPAGRLLRRRAGLHRARAAGTTRPHGRTCSPARSTEYNNDPVVIGGTTGAQGPVPDRIAACTRRSRRSPRCAQANPALADGAQVHRYASAAAGIYAFSRVDRKSKVEYLVAANNATTDEDGGRRDVRQQRDVQAPAAAPRRRCSTDAEQRTAITVPPLSVAVWKATRPIDRPKYAPAVYLTSPAARWRGRRPRRDRRRRPGEHARRGELRATARSARPPGSGSAPTTTRRTASSTTSAAWPRARWSSTAPVPRTAAATTPRRPPTAIVGDPAPAGGGGGGVGPVDPAGQRQRARRPQLRDGLRRPTGRRTATRPS